MGLTLAQMRGQLDMAIRNLYPEGWPQVPPGVQNSWLNDGYSELDRDLRWSRCNYVFSTTAGQPEYVIPVEVREKLLMEYLDTDGDLSKLQEISIEDYLDRRVSAGATNPPGDPHAPDVYCVHGDKLYLWPTPVTTGETAKLWIVTEPPALAADTDMPGFPSHLHQRVIDYAMVCVLRNFGQYVQAVALRERLHGEIMLERLEPAIQRSGDLRARISSF